MLLVQLIHPNRVRGTSAPTKPSRPPPPQFGVGTLLGGTDSVTTFHTKGTSHGTSHTPSTKKTKSSSQPISDSTSLSNQSIFTEADRNELQSLQIATKKTQSDIASIQSDLKSLISALSLDKTSQARQPDSSVPDAGLLPQTGAGL